MSLSPIVWQCQLSHCWSILTVVVLMCSLLVLGTTQSECGKNVISKQVLNKQAIVAHTQMSIWLSVSILLFSMPILHLYAGGLKVTVLWKVKSETQRGLSGPVVRERERENVNILSLHCHYSCRLNGATCIHPSQQWERTCPLVTIANS